MCNTDNIIYNYIVGLSNLIIIPYVHYHEIKTTYIYSLMFASLIYHLSETKKGLPGLPFINKYSYQLLIVDRIFGYSSMIFIMIGSYKWDILNPLWWACGYVGSSCLHYSYNAAKTPLEFAISHTIWHILGFYGLCGAVKTAEIAYRIY